MFCSKCGQKIPSGAAFCPNCGAKVQTEEPVRPSVAPAESTAKAEPAQPAPETAAQTGPAPSAGHSVLPAPQPAQDNPQPSGDPLAALVGKHADYYLTEFKKIDAGQKPRFNWAAFLLGPVMCFYRRGWELFKRYFLPIEIAWLVIPLVIMISIVVSLTSLTGPVASVSVVIMIIATLGGLAICVWNVVNSIRFGKNFNRDYYAHCKQQFAKPASERKGGTSIKNIVLYLLAMMGIELIIGIVCCLLTIPMLSVILNSVWEDDTYYSEDAYIENSSYADASSHDSEPVYEPGSSEILLTRWNEFLDSSGENEILYLEADNDCDGLLEAFAVTAGEYDADMGLYFDAKIYFINSNGKMNSVCDTAPDGSPLYGYPTEAMLSPDGGDGFFVWNLATGTSNYSLVWGVKDDRFYEANISGQYCNVSLADGPGFAAYQLDYSKGYRDYVDYRLNYDSSMHSFMAIPDNAAYPAGEGPLA